MIKQHIYPDNQTCQKHALQIYAIYYVGKSQVVIEHDLSFQLALTKIQQKFFRQYIVTYNKKIFKKLNTII